jgi:hypothetical protein
MVQTTVSTRTRLLVAGVAATVVLLLSILSLAASSAEARTLPSVTAIGQFAS